jgi:hypothetical protein
MLPNHCVWGSEEAVLKHESLDFLGLGELESLEPARALCCLCQVMLIYLVVDMLLTRITRLLHGTCGDDERWP